MNPIIPRMRSLWARFAATALDRLKDPTLLFVRLCWGWQFYLTGSGKLGNLAGTAEFFADLGLPLPGLNAVFVGALECVGGLLLLAGLGARPVAMLLFGNMAVAYLTAHRGELGSLRAFTAAEPYPFLLAALLVLAFGPGRWSVDRLLARGRRASTAAAEHGVAEVRA